MGRWLLFLIMACAGVFAQGDPPYPADTLKVVVLDASGTPWKSFDQAPYIQFKDIPFKEWTALVYRKGRLPEVYGMMGSAVSEIPWKAAEVPARLSIARCDTLEPQTFHLEVVPNRIPDRWKPPPAFISAIAITNAEGRGEFFLPAGLYTLKCSDGKFIFPDDILTVPDKEKKIAAMPAHPVEVRFADEKGKPTEACRPVYSFKVNPYGLSCAALSRKGSWSGNPAPAVLPVMGRLMVHAQCPDLLALSKELDLRDVGDILFLEGERTGKIEGEVRDEDGLPVAGQSIGLYAREGLHPLREGHSDSDGRFLFEGLRAGVYILRDVTREWTDDFAEEGEGKMVAIKGSEHSRSAAFSEDFGIIQLPPPKGSRFEETVEAEPGRTVQVRLRLEREIVWKGVVRDSAGRPLEGAVVDCDKDQTTTDADGAFTLRLRKAVLDSCAVYKDGYEPAIFRNITAREAPDMVILAGQARFQAQFRLPADVPFPPPPSIRFIKDGKDRGGRVTMKTTRGEDSTTLSVEAELESGTYTVEVSGRGLKPFRSRPFLLLDGQAYDYGYADLEPGESPSESPQEAGPILLTLVDAGGIPCPDAPLTLVWKKTDDPKHSGVVAAATDENGRFLFRDGGSLVAFYTDCAKGALLAEEASLAACNRDRACTLALRPPNALLLTITDLETSIAEFRVRVTTPVTFMDFQLKRGETRTIRNLYSPVEIRISAGRQEVFSTRMELRDGENRLEL